jgi:hypothetical protein
MQHRRRTEGAATAAPFLIGRSLFDLDRMFGIANTCTCGAPGGVYGHERHCGEVEPASECALPAWQHTTTDAEDLEF